MLLETRVYPVDQLQVRLGDVETKLNQRAKVYFYQGLGMHLPVNCSSFVREDRREVQLLVSLVPEVIIGAV